MSLPPDLPWALWNQEEDCGKRVDSSSVVSISEFLAMQVLLQNVIKRLEILERIALFVDLEQVNAVVANMMDMMQNGNDSVCAVKKAGLDRSAICPEKAKEFDVMPFHVQDVDCTDQEEQIHEHHEVQSHHGKALQDEVGPGLVEDVRRQFDAPNIRCEVGGNNGAGGPISEMFTELVLVQESDCKDGELQERGAEMVFEACSSLLGVEEDVGRNEHSEEDFQHVLIPCGHLVATPVVVSSGCPHCGTPVKSIQRLF